MLWAVPGLVPVQNATTRSAAEMMLALRR